MKTSLTACADLFAEDVEVTLPVTFKIAGGKVNYEIGKFSIGKTTVEENVLDTHTSLISDVENKWYEKLPERFIALAVNYEGVCRYVYHTLLIRDGYLKAHWKNHDGSTIKNPYIAVRETSAPTMEYLMIMSDGCSKGDRWRDFEGLRLSDGNYNRVVRGVLLADTTDSPFKVCVYDMKTKQPVVVCFDEDDLNEIKRDINELRNK